MKNAMNWFEIPVVDLDRATRFYEKILGISLRREEFFGAPMSVFPSAESGVGGALVSNPLLQPGNGGGVVYLDASGKLDACLDRARSAGGIVVTPKTAIGPHGFFALLRDSENNTFGLHSGV